MKVANLIGAALDMWVARASGAREENGVWFMSDGQFVDPITTQRTFSPSMYWAQGGPLLAQLPRIRIQENEAGFAVQSFPDPGCMLPIYGYGETILVAAMRAIVEGKFGNEVE